MDPADERQRLEAVKSALLTLRKGALLERHEIFAGAVSGRDFQRRIIHDLVDRRAIHKVTGPPQGGKGTKYQVKDIDKLEELLHSDEVLADFIWPSNRTPELHMLQPPLPFSPEKIEEAKETFLAMRPVEQAAAPPNGSGPLPAPVPVGAIDPGSIAETNHLLAELMETMSAGLQSTIFTRDQMTEVLNKVNDIEVRQKKLEEMMQSILEAWK